MTWPIAVVPAPPAVIVIAPSVAKVPAKVPATPPEVVVVLEKIGSAGTTPEVTVVESTVGTSSPSRYDSEYEKLSPAVVIL
jgi:hypothetical protein